MTDKPDIVMRLRSRAEAPNAWTRDDYFLLEVADEIERLRVVIKEQATYASDLADASWVRMGKTSRNEPVPFVADEKYFHACMDRLRTELLIAVSGKDET